MPIPILRGDNKSKAVIVPGMMKGSVGRGGGVGRRI